MNLDAKQFIGYLVSVLGHFGINYVQLEDFRRAKLNEQPPGSHQVMERLLFDLCLLHMFDFKFNLLETPVDISTEHRRQVILAHLCESECPYLVNLEEHDEVGLNFSSPRQLLLCVGWVLAVADIFSRVQDAIMGRMVEEIENIRPEAASLNNNKVSGNHRQISLKQQNKTITGLCKSIAVRLHSLECLKAKKQKLIHRISTFLDTQGIRMSFAELMSADKSYHKMRLAKTKELIEVISREVKDMRCRKHFWLWMDSVIKRDREELQNQRPEDFGFEEQPKRVVEKIEVDVFGIQGFLEDVENIEQKYQQLEPFFEVFERCWEEREKKLTEKESKELALDNRIIKAETECSVPGFKPGVALKYNSFIGNQLHGIIFEAESENNQGEDAGNGEKEGKILKRQLLRLCQQNIQRLEALAFI